VVVVIPHPEPVEGWVRLLLRPARHEAAPGLRAGPVPTASL